MANRRQRQPRSSVSPITGIVALLFIAMMIWIAVSAVKGVFTILSWFALPLFIIAIIFNYRVVTDYIQWVYNNIKADPLKGLLIAGGSVIGYPLVSAWLAFKAYTSRALKKKAPKDGSKGDYIKYEESKAEDEDFLELPDLKDAPVKQKQAQNKTNDYEDLFE